MRPQVVQRSTKPLSDDHKSVLKKLDDFEEVINNLDKPETIMPTLKELGTFFKGEIWKRACTIWPLLDSLSKRGGCPVPRNGEIYADRGWANRCNAS